MDDNAIAPAYLSEPYTVIAGTTGMAVRERCAWKVSSQT